ncbi:CAP domain-containing protein [Anaeromyxobacter oryzisoli]|uniref:CAP domain-containing protein n=1 Tax=Anaeromyxobacter oryzisoli TaxID=2925408 RepID=UPI001F560D6D|nr:CAP domain-containing protein [Anaeromyxobacter sp. SG63]
MIASALPLRRLAGAALAAALGAGCAANTPAPARASSSTAPAAPLAPPSRGASPAPRYGAEPDVALSPVEAAALAAIRAQVGTGPRPRVSGALILAARALARGAADGAAEPIGPSARRAGLAAGLAWDPAPIAFLVRGRAEDLPAAVAGAIVGTAASHVGVGAARAGDATVLVLLASDRKLRLDPFPREVAPGSAATLSGALERGLRHARVFATLPSGEARELPTSGARAFRAAVDFPASGRYVLEVVGDGRGGPEVAALLAVTAGAPAPIAGAGASRPEATSARPPAGEDDEAAVIRALDALRAAHGLRPLEPSRELAAVARRHSERMLAAGRIAHVLPGSGELTDRLRAASVPFRRAYENVARGGTARAAHDAAEESPAHRSNMLQAGATRVGVGLARGRLPSGGAAVYLTEIFVEPPDEGAQSPLRPAARVREALWRERARLGRPPLTADAALDALAADAAEELRERDAIDPRELDGRALALRRNLAAADVFVASAPDDAIRSANLRDARFRRVGVGVATGDSRRFGAGRLFIAVVYTD